MKHTTSEHEIQFVTSNYEETQFR